MNVKNSNSIHPREVADKSEKVTLKSAIDMALAVETEAVRLNTQTFNRQRYSAIGRLDNYEELKTRARLIKEESIERLPELIETVTRAVQARGGTVFIAADAKEAVKYIRKICIIKGAKLVVKAKSITSEEIGLNEVLEKEKIEVAETDLAEFILQVSGEQPSHIVAPAIHRSRERISKLFKEHFDTDKPLDTGEQLTEFARDILRQKFLSADIGISGANLIAAKEGALLLVESEGNIRLSTHLPAVHISIAGIEKIIPEKKDFGTFIELLAASGTGQPLTSYTNILEPPLPLPVLGLNGRNDEKREFHLVLIDNGRMKMREDKELMETLYCIRCSACMNSCSNFQTVGGHAFGGECYTGGIGAAWTVGTSGKLEKGRFAELCSGCSRCVPNCPVKINIPQLNNVIKERLIKAEGASLQKTFFGNFATVAKLASAASGLSNFMASLPVSRQIMESLIGFDKRRDVPRFANPDLAAIYKKYRKKNITAANAAFPGEKTVLFADVYTNYNNPQVGMAVVKLFDRLGIPVILSEMISEGRAAQSQGLLKLAAKEAKKTAVYLGRLIDEGNKIILAEPSVLAMFRRDYRDLIDNNKLFNKIADNSFDPIEYISILTDKKLIDINERITTDRKAGLFYHGHCQMKTVGAAGYAPGLFKTLGFNVEVSAAECCGMAGSFGYKKDYYELSKNIGNDLIKQIKGSKLYNNEMVILACGTSCREQIGAEIKDHEICHPVEFLNKITS